MRNTARTKTLQVTLIKLPHIVHDSSEGTSFLPIVESCLLYRIPLLEVKSVKASEEGNVLVRQTPVMMI
jgi:hypothetical protein